MNLRRMLSKFKVKTLKSAAESEVDLQMILGDLNPDVAKELAAAFDDVPSATVIEGDLLCLPCEAIVSPANSFGDMGGGIDKAIDAFFQGEAQRRVRETIMSRHFGELPVGSAEIVKISGKNPGMVVVAPTMRVPGKITDSVNVYLSFRAALVAVIRYNRLSENPIRSLAVPGLGTGVGGMAYADAAQQMREAYRMIVEGGWKEVSHSAMAPYVMRRLA